MLNDKTQTKKYATIGVTIAYNNETAFTAPVKEKCMILGFP